MKSIELNVSKKFKDTELPKTIKNHEPSDQESLEEVMDEWGDTL